MGFLGLFLVQLYRLVRMLYPKFSGKLEKARERLESARQGLSW